MSSPNTSSSPNDEGDMADPIAEQPMASSTPLRRPRRRLFASAAVTLALLVAVTLSVVLLAHVRAQTGGVGLSSATATQSILPGWRRYREPDGYFTVAVPEGWTAPLTVGHGTMGDPTGSSSFTTTTVALGGPPDGSRTITVDITVTPITDTYERHPQSVLTQGQQQMASILASFRPNPDTPLDCH